MKFSPSTDEHKMVVFEVEDLKGKTCTFEIPKLEYRTRRVQNDINDWVRENATQIDGHDLFIHTVGIYDKSAAKYLESAELEGGQFEAMLEYYRKESGITEGESKASSDS